MCVRVCVRGGFGIMSPTYPNVEDVSPRHPIIDTHDLHHLNLALGTVGSERKVLPIFLSLIEDWIFQAHYLVVAIGLLYNLSLKYSFAPCI